MFSGFEVTIIMDDDIDIYGDLENFDEKKDENVRKLISQFYYHCMFSHHYFGLIKERPPLENFNYKYKIDFFERGF